MTGVDVRADRARAKWILAVMSFGGLGAAVMQTLVIPLQGDLPDLLGTSRANASWVITVTLLTGAAVMPLAGRLSDLYGRRKVLAATATMMALGSVVCALGDSLTPILIGRALQGIAMGYIPVAISLVRDVMPPRQVPTAISVISATMGVGGAVGLPISAWIAQEHDWHSPFWMSTVVAVLIVVSTLVVVPSTPPADDASLDLVGAAGLALGLGALLVGVSKGNEWGWSTPSTLACVLGGTLVLLLWGRHQLGHRSPLVDLRANSRRPVLVTNLAALLVGFGMMASSIAVPQLMILPTTTGHGLGLSLLEAGLWMTPGGSMMLLLAPVAARLIGGIGARLTLAIGAALLGSGYAAATVFMATPWQLALAMCLAMSGVAIAYAAMPTLVLAHVPPEGAGAAVGLNGLMRAVGTTCAGAVIAAVLTSVTTEVAGASVPSGDAFVLCFAIGSVVSLLGAGVTLFIPRREPVRRPSGAVLDRLEH